MASGWGRDGGIGSGGPHRLQERDEGGLGPGYRVGGARQLEEPGGAVPGKERRDDRRRAALGVDQEEVEPVALDRRRRLSEALLVHRLEAGLAPPAVYVGENAADVAREGRYRHLGPADAVAGLAHGASGQCLP